MNDICKFEVLNKTHFIKNGVNIITSVFFKHERYYKNFGIYVNGLQKIINFIDDKKNNGGDNKFIFVLFIDQNIFNDDTIMNIINKSQYTVPVLFKCAKYTDDKYHYDLFGTLVRFFPMFNFSDNPCNIVICVDIDLHDEDYIRLLCLIKHKPSGITGSGDFARLIYKDQPSYIYAHLVCYNREKYDYDLIINFIRTAENIQSTGNYGKRLTTFGFGIDEIFLNDIFIPKLKNYKTIIDYQISYFLYHSRLRILKKPKTSANILSMIIQNDKILSLENMLQYIDKYTYHIRYKTEINNNFSRRFTYVTNYLEKNHRRWLEKNVQHFIYKYLKNIISTNLIIESNYKNGIIDAKVYDTIYDSDYSKPGTIEEKINYYEEEDEEFNII